MRDMRQMQDRSVSVSIVIVNWNTRDLLIECIRSILEHATDISIEIIVVDNASADHSVQAVRKAFPSVKLIASKANLGFAAGNNLGIAEATGEHILLLNPDTLVTDDSIERMHSFLQQHPEAGAVGCRIVNPDQTPQESYWMRFPSLGWLLLRAFYLDKVVRRFGRPSTASDAPFAVAHLLGACMMIPRSVLEELGGFDESYFLYLEETDLCCRIVGSGRQVYHLPSASIVHFGQQSSIQAAEWTNVEFYLSTYKFVRRHSARGAAAGLVLRGVIALSALVRMILWTARLCVRRGGRASAARMLKGYWRLCWTTPRFERLYRKGLSASGQTAPKSGCAP
jgi:GT2 family glycosyltransferase